MKVADCNPELKLFPNVIPVRGYNRSLLVDLQRGKCHLVPNDLIDCLEQNTVAEVEAYARFIMDHELGLFVHPDVASCLTALPLDYYPGSAITSAILELDKNSSWSIPAVLNQLDELGTQFLEVRFLDFYAVVNHLRMLRVYSNETTIESIRILVPYTKNLEALLNSLLSERFFRLNTIHVYDAPCGFELAVNFYNLVFSKQESVGHENCGNVSPEYFRMNTQSYIRSKHYNSCLAHKISIDKQGLIGNCPSMKERFGHIDNKPLSQVLEEVRFQEKWGLTKDKIWICSVCEFREVCSDCRAFTRDGVENGKPSKCGYNPFISLWKGDANYLSEEECGIRFENGELLIPEEQINRINARIWGSN